MPKRITIDKFNPESDFMLGQLIQHAREAKGMTRSQVARKIGKTHPFIGMLERGVRRYTLATLVDVLKAIDQDYTVTSDGVSWDGYQILMNQRGPEVIGSYIQILDWR